MQAFANVMIVAGNLGADFVLKHTGSGHKYSGTRLAINERYKDAEGETQVNTQWISIRAWGNMAETLAKWGKKGRNMLFTGKIRSDSWVDHEGTTQYFTYMEVESFQFLDAKPDLPNDEPADGEPEEPPTSLPGWLRSIANI